ncbi:MAG: site-2 protease family protein [Moorea sp. SIO3C2]|nr:site-2 protease family protein [Moorena sp. SIO3C2]
MRSGWRVGSLFGIPLFLDPSWFFILLLVTMVNAREFDSSLGSILAWVAGLAMALLLFSSVLLHELGHSLAALSQGIKVNSITLFIFGGIASIDRESKTPGEAFQVAIAGPLVSFILFGLFYVLTLTLPTSAWAYTIANEIARINLVLALFNLIPGLPLDGGQVLKAAVWKLTGDLFTGVRWAARTGKGFGLIALSLGLGMTLLTGTLAFIWPTLIGWFIFRNASAYDQLTTLQEVLLKLMASNAMTRDFRVVEANQTLRSFADEYILTDSQNPMPYYAATNGRYRGLVKIEDLHFVERSRWDTETLETIVRPLSEIPTVQEKTPLVEVINSLEELNLKRLSVLSPAGAVAGVIDRGDIVRAVARKLNLAIPPAAIERIKAEGIYPPGFQLVEIAKTLNSLTNT